MRLLSLVAAALLAGAPAAHADTGHLVGTVGPGFTIDLTDATGTHVDSVVAGTYEIVVHDLSDQHNFVLGEKATGDRPVQTTVPFVGDQAFTVTLRPGEWVYACSPHFQIMFGRLAVVAPTLTITLARNGRVKLSSVAVGSGTYTLTVVDRSPKLGVRLAGKTTSARFTGTVTWTVRLPPGTYRIGAATLTVS